MRDDLRRAQRRPLSRSLVRHGWLIVVLMVVPLLLSACNSTNEYPIDFFSEMHYERSYHQQEPPRLDSPLSAVPYNGGNDNVGGGSEPDASMVRPNPDGGAAIPDVVPAYTAQEAHNLKNPLPMSANAIAAGQTLFEVNCAVCHGKDGKGDGIAATIVFKANNKTPPANLTQTSHPSPIDNKPADLTDGDYFYVLSNGYIWMPDFGHLLTVQERWELVDYIRHLQGQG